MTLGRCANCRVVESRPAALSGSIRAEAVTTRALACVVGAWWIEQRRQGERRYSTAMLRKAVEPSSEGGFVDVGIPTARSGVRSGGGGGGSSAGSDAAAS